MRSQEVSPQQTRSKQHSQTDWHNLRGVFGKQTSKIPITKYIVAHLMHNPLVENRVKQWPHYSCMRAQTTERNSILARHFLKALTSVTSAVQNIGRVAVITTYYHLEGALVRAKGENSAHQAGEHDTMFVTQSL